MSPRFLFLAGSALLGAGGLLTAAKPAASPTFVAKMTGAQETPPNQAAATGTATFDLETNELEFTIEVKGLSGAPTAAHVHVGAPGVKGPHVYDIVLRAGAGTKGVIAKGEIDLTKEVSPGVSGDSLKALLKTGNAYVNVHTKKFPDGETRGQLMQEL